MREERERERERGGIYGNIVTAIPCHPRFTRGLQLKAQLLPGRLQEKRNVKTRVGKPERHVKSAQRLEPQRVSVWSKRRASRRRVRRR